MSTAPSEPSLFDTLREAVRGTEQDLTAIPIRRSVLLLAVPVVLEMSMESLLTIVDTFFVAKLGSRAVATVGLTEAMLSFVYAASMGISSAATAVIARRTGEKNPEAAAVAAVQVIGLALVCALVLGLVGAPFARQALTLMGATADVVEYGARYTATMFAGSATIFLLYVVNAIFRAAGDASIAMRSLWIANLSNMALCPLFVFGLGPFPRMGVLGAAVAMTLGRGIGVAYQLAMLRRRTGRLSIGVRHLRPDFAVLRELARIGANATLQILVETASWLGLVRILSSFGSAALAGYTIAMRVAIFALLPSWGFASAAAALVGQNLGAKAPERAVEAVRTVARYNVVFLGTVGLFLALFPGFVVQFFTHEPEVAALGAACLRVVALGFVFFAYGMVVIQAFNGAGDTRTPMWVNIACFWLVKIPGAYLLARGLGLGPQGVFFAIAFAYSLQAVFGWVLFQRGRWKTVQLSA